MSSVAVPESVLRSTFDELGPVYVMSSVRDGSGRIVDFRYEFLNAAALAQNEDPEGSLIGKHMLDMFPSHAENGLFDAYCRVVESGEPLLTEVWFDEGPIRGWFEVHATKFGDGCITAARDVTRRRASEDLVRTQAATLRATFDSFLNPHVVLNAVRDESGVIVDFVYTEANDKACEYNQIPRERLIGARLLDLLPGHAGSGLLEMYAGVVESGEPLDLEDFAYSQEILGGEHRFDILATKVGDGLSYTWRDVTSRHNAAVAHWTMPQPGWRKHSTRLESAIPDAFKLLAGLQVLIAMFRLGFAVFPPVPNSPRVADVVLSGALLLLGALTWSVRRRRVEPFLDVSLMLAVTLIGVVVATRTLDSSQVSGALSLVLLVVFAAYHRSSQRMWQLVFWTLLVYGAAMWFNPKTPSPLYFVIAAIVLVILAEVVSVLVGRIRADAAMMQAVLDSSTDQIVRYDRDGRAEYVNDEVVRFTGVSREQWIGHDPAELGFPEQRAQTVLRHIRRVFDEGVGHRFEISYDHPAGLHHFEVSLSPVVDGRGNVEAVMADSRDMSERHQTEAELADRATHDRLTGLANREVLIAEVDRALAACRRSGRSVGLLMIDLDHFKNVNDALGHEAGDHLLIAVAARLASIARAGDLIARLGGDEFVIVLRDIEGITAAVRQAQRAVDAFHSPVQFDEHDIYTTTSIGVALSTSDSTSSDLLREADTALYLAKGRGRDKVGVFSASLRVAATERLQVEADLQPALERGQFAVWYQPQIDLRTGEVVAVEALLRWHHPSGEVLNADQFIDLAEDSGMISDIGDWALLEACTQTARWNAEPGAPQLAIGVNISTRQLAEADLFAKVAAALTLSGLDPTLLCIEITETTLLVQTTESRENLRRLHAAGIRLAIDDFGTGYASLAYLREIHVDTVKIDRSFVSDIATNDFDRRLIDGIIALADRLGVDVIAEGVETEEQADTLRALGCTSAQGYLYSRAVPADELQRQHHPPATRAP